MMWDLGGRHTQAPVVAMPVPSTSQPHHHRRTSSAPRVPDPAWTASRVSTPAPVIIPIPSSSRPVVSLGGGGGHSYEDTSRGFLHPSHQPRQAHRDHNSHRRHSHSHSHSHSSHRQDQHHAQPAPAAPHALVHRPFPAAPHWMYSKCTGRRRALCIGINYHGQSHELRGCINDAKHIFSFLVRHAGYKREDIVVLSDDSPYARSQPTRSNMLDAMRWLVKDAKPHDALFFHYSGHGGQVRDKDGDEADESDETIYPVDYQRVGPILDDEMHDVMVKPLPPGCRLTSFPPSAASHHHHTNTHLTQQYDHHGRLKRQQITDKWRNRKASPADVISISGCRDDQTSVDTFAHGEAVGAASHAFIKAVEDHPRQSYQELLRNLRTLLCEKYTQKPQLGSSHPFDTSLKFIM
ncbi:caspase domain-containing protein [Favolaschia claudopus]|uniref:Caspase domain-containing protein n=1 Tax=Favolaschia claudopus TaxID=2862362 RepID=A0AAW0E9T9_9AGAR